MRVQRHRAHRAAQSQSRGGPTVAVQEGLKGDEGEWKSGEDITRRESRYCESGAEQNHGKQA